MLHDLAVSHIHHFKGKHAWYLCPISPWWACRSLGPRFSRFSRFSRYSFSLQKKKSTDMEVCEVNSQGTGTTQSTGPPNTSQLALASPHCTCLWTALQHCRMTHSEGAAQIMPQSVQQTHRVSLLSHVANFTRWPRLARLPRVSLPTCCSINSSITRRTRRPRWSSTP